MPNHSNVVQAAKQESLHSIPQHLVDDSNVRDHVVAEEDGCH
jgi:hypothetical protein